MEQTLAIIKPDGVSQGLAGEIIRRIESENIRITGIKMILMDKRKAEGFYYIHRHKSFFSSLIEFMTSGPVILMVLSGPDVIARWRRIMGTTDPAAAEAGTIRAIYGLDIEHNIVHGSDSPDNALFEITYFFKPDEMVGS
jgi:nucleoside-diphosphate kinase